MQLGYLIERRFLFCRKQILPFLGLILDLLHQPGISFQFRADTLNILFHAALALGNMVKLIPENNHIFTQLFHCFRKGRDGVFHCVHQLAHGGFQFPQQSIIRFDLTVNLAAVRDNTLFLHSTGSHTLVDGRLFVQTSCGMAAVVYPCVDPWILRQIFIGYICPFLTPDQKLLVAVPALGNGILSAILGAFGMLGRSDKSLRFGGRRGHIHLFLSYLVLILLLPAIGLRCLELGRSKTPFLAIPDTEIFFLGLVLPLALFIQRAHCQHNVSVWIVTRRVRIVDCNISAHPVRYKLFLYKFGQQLLPF